MRETGAKLRAAREARHLSLDDVTRSTHLPLRTLSAFEEGRVADLPPPLYARSFLRQYAALLDLPPEELVSDLDRDLPLAAAPGPSFEQPGRSRRPARGSLAGTLALLLLALGSALFYRHTLTIAARPDDRIANATSSTETASPAVGVVLVETPSPSPPLPSPTALTLAAASPLPTATSSPAPSPTATLPPSTPTPARPTTIPTATNVPRASPAPPTATRPAVAVAATARPQPVLPPPPSDAVPTPDRTATPDATYHVRRGDTLTAIARHYGLSVTDLARDNGMADPSKLRAGQTLRMPR